jgi:mono/diheme cytochrome c family protein
MNTKTMMKLTIATGAFAILLCGTVRAEDASVIWGKTCAGCHGKDGKGDTKMGHKLDVKDYTDAKVQASFTDEKATQAIKEGVKDESGKDKMKAYADKYSDEEIKSLVAYVRDFKAK